jgi:hypothetical protein
MDALRTFSAKTLRKPSTSAPGLMQVKSAGKPALRLIFA